MKKQSNQWAALSAGVIVATCGAVANAQYFQKLFGTERSETPRGVAQCSNEDMLTTGFRQVDGSPRTYASRHRSDGSLVWAWDYPEGSASTGWSALESQNADIIVGGFTTAVGPSLQVSLMRLSPLGAVQWAAAYEGTGFGISDVLVGVRENVAMAEVSDIGFVAVTTEARPGFNDLTQAQMLLVNQNGAPLFQKSYIPDITFPPVGVSFNDLRLDTASPNLGYVVTGTVRFEPIPGSGNPATYEALYARFDVAGNPISAFSYRLVAASGGPSYDTYGDGIETLPGGDVVIAGRTNAVGASLDDAAVLRINPAGAVVWARAISGVAPAAAAMSRSAERVITSAGTSDGAGPGNIGLLAVDELGTHVFSRAFSPASPGLQSLGRDQVWLGGSHPGWAIVGDEVEPESFGFRDVDLIRTDAFGRTGCEERDIPAQVDMPLVQIRQLNLLQSSREQWTYRDMPATDPQFQSRTLCEGKCPCPGDASGDGVVDFNDTNATLAAWGSVYAPGTGPGDANCDGIVDFEDINTILAMWGSNCP